MNIKGILFDIQGHKSQSNLGGTGFTGMIKKICFVKLAS